MRAFWFICVLLGAINVVFSQVNKSQNKQVLLKAVFANEPILIDGILSEQIWDKAIPTTPFFQHFPYDTSFANDQTLVKVAYDNQKLYIAAVCYDNNPQKPYVNPTLRRDFTDLADNFMVYLDFFGDETTGFAFGVTPFGVEREGLISYGSSVNFEWDNVWYSAVKQIERAYVVEMAIPFASVRLPKNLQNLRINFARQNQKTNERSSWMPINRAFSVATLAFTATLQLEQPLQLGRGVFSIIPYLNSSANQDFTAENTQIIPRYGIGGDAKVAVTPSLNLDITVNPDFSQVEVDRQVTNLSRFELFFPERRQFFIENSDLFASFGFSRIRPFFSRRIGVATDPFTRQFKEAPIYYGLRLSGRVDDKWRIGIMNLQTAADESINLQGTNYAVAAVQRQFGRSNLSGILVNKQVFENSNGDFSFNTTNFNRVVGLDYNLLSKNNKWRGKYFLHKLITPNNLGDQFAHAVYQSYSDQNWYFEYNHEIIGKHYQPEVGFVPRNNLIRLEHAARRFFYPKRSKLINNHGISLRSDYYMQKVNNRFLDYLFTTNYFFNFQNGASATIGYQLEEIFLNFAFDPSNSRQQPLPAGDTYQFGRITLNYVSDRRKDVNGSAYFDYGTYFNGTRLSASGNLVYRIMPYGLISLDATFNNLEFPHLARAVNLYLIGPGFDWAFNRKVFLRVVSQYNNQINNVNTNIRLQWRYRPVSDFFLVYSDNYETGAWAVRNRGVVVKWVYWLNTR